MINKAFKEFYRCLPLMGQGLRLVWGAARGWTVAWGALLLLQGLMPAALVYLVRLTVNRLSGALGSHSGLAAFSDVWFPALLIGLLWVVGQLLTSLAAWVRTAQAELVQDSIHSLIHQKALELDVAFYENPESYDLLHRARIDAIPSRSSCWKAWGFLFKTA
jgi:ATP-binding cassette subfamily B protein